MTLRRPSRLTILLALPFVLVVVADAVDTWLASRRGDGDVIRDAAVRFVPVEQLIRPGVLQPGVASDGAALGDGWLEDQGGGRWLSPSGAVLLVRLPQGGQRLVAVELHGAAGRRAPDLLELRVNGETVGSVALRLTFQRHRFLVPATLFQQGLNRIELLPRGGNGPRGAFIRLVAVAMSGSADIDDMEGPDGLTVDREAGWLSMSRPGRAVLDLGSQTRPAGLDLKTRFTTRDGRLPRGRAEVAVVCHDQGIATDLETVEFAADRAVSDRSRVEFPICDRVEVVVMASPEAEGEAFVIESLRRREP
jgi:hypothetical protein